MQGKQVALLTGNFIEIPPYPGDAYRLILVHPAAQTTVCLSSVEARPRAASTLVSRCILMMFCSLICAHVNEKNRDFTCSSDKEEGSGSARDLSTLWISQWCN